MSRTNFMGWIGKTIKWTALLCIAVILSVLGPPAAYLSYVWTQDPKALLPDPVTGHGDFSRLESATPAEVVSVNPIPTVAERQLADVIARANRQHLKVSISGAKHSMGGHTIYPGGIVLDMLPFNHMSIDENIGILTVGAGAKWDEVIPFLDHHSWAIAVMQSNNDFSVGGSLSVNCHGWQPDAPPISSTVESFRLITADGKIVTCSRSENSELFSLALGGYGLFGIILDARLRLVRNEFYQAVSSCIQPEDYARDYNSRIQGHSNVGMAFGRIAIAPAHFLDEALLVSFQRCPGTRPLADTLAPVSPRLLERLLFRGCVDSSYGKNLCWNIEKWEGGAPPGVNSRNQIMNTPSDWFANRDPNATEILHEYFVPPEKLADFLHLIRPILQEDKPDLLNITVRKVQADRDTKLAYARKDVLGLVMFFHQTLSRDADAHMAAFTRKMIDVALACDGTYYLPYRPHATVSQFEKAYPQAHTFFEAKRKYDPNGIFQNEFYQRYGDTGRNAAQQEKNDQ